MSLFHLTAHTATTSASGTPNPSTTMAASSAMAPTSHNLIGQLLGSVLLGFQDALIAYTEPAELPAAIANFTQGILQTWYPVTANGTAAAIAATAGTVAATVQSITNPASTTATGTPSP